MLNLFILPRWETTHMLDMKSVVVEEWLGALMSTKNSGKTLENATRQRIRNIFSVLFTHAQRYEFVPIGHNPIKLVRQSGKRSRIPTILTASQVQALWTGSGPRERAAISLEFGNGLRRCEAFALQWRDLNFVNATASVLKGIVRGHVGDVKTEISRKVVPLHAYQLEALAAWRAVSPYSADDDWVFASSRSRGKKPVWPDMILRRSIQPLARKLGIEGNVGWHTFRRTFCSLLKASGEDIKVVQELMRHAVRASRLVCTRKRSAKMRAGRRARWWRWFATHRFCRRAKAAAGA